MPLIDRDALKKQMCKICNENYSDDPCEPNDCVFLNAIDSAPTIDAVPVARCAECWKSADGLCSYQLKNVPGKDFCGDGERRSE